MNAQLFTLVEGHYHRPAPAHTRRIALIGNFPPRRCGIATFTSDLRDALSGGVAKHHCDVYAMSERGNTYTFPPEVTGEIRQDMIGDYIRAAHAINRSGVDAVCIQHEFGIFGGSAGDNILELLDVVTAPVVVTLHTVLADPNDDQRRVTMQLAERSSKLVVMADKGSQILRNAYGVSPDRIAVIPHGTPDCPFIESEPFKAELGFAGRDVLLTFGLLSPNKGIEHMIRSLPQIVARFPNALYVVLGATHPHLLAHEGEAYRETLSRLAGELGVGRHIRFINEYTDKVKLLRYLAATDVYVTPYLNEAQITSGTLSYAVGLGKAVVSTPYWHAQELLAQDRGVLVPFANSVALAGACATLLGNASLRETIRANAYRSGREAIWPRAAERYASLFRSLAKTARPSGAALPPIPIKDSDAARRLTRAIAVGP
jgi:glycosyltransferase involved in cell wall biosynthesis